ncbi:chorismate-binding protein [Sulfuriroseicoccus oceanibius]|uniref:Chorismate-binding protein n=1 Tax=Sulfuriroseicoccus oceanibius TaxID=2707525 RepID=A0A6B3LBF3_9BACT|nr:chorismate-binding protein [Sulfuriroseicoccus oceanibius]QQL44505.1 chorismate-binding protein [Sulfuriroseicoccus oceanibius]
MMSDTPQPSTDSGNEVVRGSADDFAFLRVPGLGFCVGRGPFRELADEPGDGVDAFYAGDFQMTDPRPWKVPASFWVADDLTALAKHIGETLPEISWDSPGFRQWEGVFSKVSRDLSAGRYEKIVPAVVESGRVVSGDLDALVHRLPELPEEYWTYGYRVGSRGLVGATPERLFSLTGDELITMALAGTAPVERRAPFVNDPKQIREHEIVVRYLIDALDPLGEVVREKREVMSLGSIVHFRSALKVKLSESPGVDALVRRLHPTPALGVLPRNAENLELLGEMRDRLGVPKRFGAPFGVRVGGSFHGVVGIRHICWRGTHALLPAGCGVIAESECENEWKELAIKRESVKRLFGI